MTPTAPNRILIIKPSALGDVVTAMPVLRGLRRAFPRAHISWLVATSCADLICHDSDLNEIILFDRRHLGHCWRSPRAAKDLAIFLHNLRKERFDWVLDLQGLLRSAIFTFVTRAGVRAGFAHAREGSAVLYTDALKVQARHTVEQNIELAATLGVQARREDFTLQVSQSGREFAAEFLRTSGLREKEFLVCVPPTRWKTKLYPMRHWRTVVGELSRTRPVVLLGAPGDKQLCESIVCGTGVSPVSEMEQQRPGNCKNRGETPLEHMGRMPMPRVLNLAGQTSVAQMVGVIAASGGVICCDSAAKFIAPAVGVPAVALLGPTRVEHTGAFSPSEQVKVESIVAPVPCQGCLKKRCRHITCMELIDPASVVQAARRAFILDE